MRTTHDPYKDPAFYDLAEEQMVDIPLDARCMVVKDPRETVVELDGENQTLGGTRLFAPAEVGEHRTRDHEARLVELIQNYQAAVGCLA